MSVTYILLITYLYNGVQYNLPIEEYSSKSYCDTALVETSRALHQHGKPVLASSCVLANK